MSMEIVFSDLLIVFAGADAQSTAAIISNSLGVAVCSLSWRNLVGMVSYFLQIIFWPM